MFKSRFRGVYKCGKRWKAQLQSQGVQFYLGTFDTEKEAAKAYDRKARDEKGEKGQTNFDDNGDETLNQGDVTDEFLATLQQDLPRQSKRPRTSPAATAVIIPGQQGVYPVVPEMLFSPENTSIQVNI
jgi:AP2 domain